MDFITKLNIELSSLHLLNHPFYKLWNEGKLSLEILQIYAKEYYHHVAAFPRYISGIHTLCADIKARQILLENLIDEEQGMNNHPELWIRFFEGLGGDRNQIENTPQLQQTVNLVEGYFDIVRSNYYSGLGALYAYERQTPAVSSSKIDGLQKHYHIRHPAVLEFFTTHQQADEWHTEELVGLMKQIDHIKEKKLILEGAIKGAHLLWKFLDGIHELFMIKQVAI